MVRVIALILLAFMPPEFAWKYEVKVSNINIQSIYKLNNNQKNKIIKIYKKSYKLFFKDFAKTSPDTCQSNGLTIRLISQNDINKKISFNDTKSKGEVFGRYFWRYNILYITDEIFENEDYMAHEIFHWLCDECSIFMGIDEEEINAYKFQEIYKTL